jgi:CDP-diacylglycerol--glycerol-3-phosphate 3-phosphatidyltransferase
MGMNWPNRLTIARMIMAPVFMGLLLSSRPGCRYAAFAVFLVASLTDFVDGHLARRHGWVSNLGKFLDPLADKLLVSLAFIGLSQLSLVPVWAVYAVVGRELLVTGLRSIAAYAGVLILPSRLGKLKAVMQMVVVLFYLLAAVMATGGSEFPAGVMTAGWWVMTASVAITLGSGLHYLWVNRRIVGRLGL